MSRGHRDDHLADGLGLRGVAVLDLVELGDAVDQHRDLVAEVLAQRVERCTRCPRPCRAAGRRPAWAASCPARPGSSATATGWVMYGSPLLRFCPRVRLAATSNARSITTRSALGCEPRTVRSSGSSSGDVALRPRPQPGDPGEDPARARQALGRRLAVARRGRSCPRRRCRGWWATGPWAARRGSRRPAWAARRRAERADGAGLGARGRRAARARGAVSSRHCPPASPLRPPHLRTARHAGPVSCPPGGRNRRTDGFSTERSSNVPAA